MVVTPIPFSDDPEGQGVVNAIDAHQAPVGLDRFLVGLAVLFAKIAPVTQNMTVHGGLEQRGQTTRFQRSHHVRRGHDLAKFKQGLVHAALQRFEL